MPFCRRGERHADHPEPPPFHGRSHGAGAASLIGISKPARAEPPPETTTVRLPRYFRAAYCWAAMNIAGELLRAEGFTDVRYVQGDKTSIIRC